MMPNDTIATSRHGSRAEQVAAVDFISEHAHN
jgi:hypothetical protein